MFQLWNNQSSNSFLANFKSDLLDQQQHEIAKLMLLISNQQLQIASTTSNLTLAKADEKNDLPFKQTIPSQTLASQSLSSQPTKKISKKAQSKKRRKNKQRCYLEGRWTSREHNQYLAFLNENSKFMESANSKREQQIFKQMSELIRSRTAAQCRSHHKKFDFRRYLTKMSLNSSQVSEQ